MSDQFKCMCSGKTEYRLRGCAKCMLNIPEITEQSNEPLSTEITMWRNLKPGPPIILGEKDWNNLMDALENPPPPTPALIKARERYVEMKKQQIQAEMDEHMVKTSSPKKL